MSVGSGKGQTLAQARMERLQTSMHPAAGSSQLAAAYWHPGHRQKPGLLRHGNLQGREASLQMLSVLPEGPVSSASFPSLCGFSFSVVLLCSPSVCAGSFELLKFSKKVLSDRPACCPVESLGPVFCLPGQPSRTSLRAVSMDR